MKKWLVLKKKNAHLVNKNTEFICVKKQGHFGQYFTEGKKYNVSDITNYHVSIFDNDGDSNGWLYGKEGSDESIFKFRNPSYKKPTVVTKENGTNLSVGDYIKCEESVNEDWFTKGRLYKVVHKNSTAVCEVRDNEGDCNYRIFGKPYSDSTFSFYTNKSKSKKDLRIEELEDEVKKLKETLGKIKGLVNEN